MNDYVIINTNDYLCHHGILGQKWGVRRYQNKDGSLTSLGKNRSKEYISKEQVDKMSKEEQSKMALNIAMSNKKDIAKQLSEMMIGDMKRWTKESGEDHFNGKDPKTIQKKIISDIENQLQKLDKREYGNPNLWSNLIKGHDVIAEFSLDDVKDYFDQPIYVYFDPNKKKVIDFGWV